MTNAIDVPADPTVTAIVKTVETVKHAIVWSV